MHALSRPAGAFALALSLLAGAAPTASAESRSETEAGLALAERYCAECHAIAHDDESPHVEAPPFRSLHENYPVEHLAEALAEGIMVGHPAMPQFVFQPEEIDAFIAYLKTLERG